VCIEVTLDINKEGEEQRGEEGEEEEKERDGIKKGHIKKGHSGGIVLCMTGSTDYIHFPAFDDNAAAATSATASAAPSAPSRMREHRLRAYLQVLLIDFTIDRLVRACLQPGSSSSNSSIISSTDSSSSSMHTATNCATAY
jgi:hypothetical protein